MTYRFASPQPADFERIFLGAKLLNSYSPVLLAALGLDELKIYNYASFVDCAHVKYPVALLSGYYPQLRALMDSIYGSAYGFYAGECTTTLYVSHFIVFNVPSLAQMHPENATQYYTEAEMVEHNYPLDDVSNAIRRMLSGEPEEETPAAVEEPSKSENEKAEKAVTEGVADIETPNQENTAPVEETVATDENEPSSAPVTDETSDKTTEAASADETNAVEAEAEVEKEIETERSVDNEEIAPPTQAQMLANTLASALAHTETEAPAVKIPAFPTIAAVADKETEPPVVKTPEGDQITLDITEAQSDDDGIITLDLDSID